MTRSRWFLGGLRGRITATVVLCVLMSTLVVSTAAYVLQERHSRERFATAALLATRSDGAQASALVQNSAVEDSALEDSALEDFPLGGFPSEDPVDVVADYLAGRQGVEWVVLSRSTAGLPARYSPGLSPELDPADELEGILDRGAPTPITLQGRSFLAVRADAGIAAEIVEFYDLRPLEAELTQLRHNVVRVGLPVLLCTAVLGVLMAGRIAQPIARASAAARRMEAGDLSARLPVTGRDELAELSNAFNDMAGELGRTLTELRRMDAQHRRFTADVSHELRTPLASLVAAADSADAEDPHVRQRAGVLLREQTRRLAGLVQDLLEMSRFDAGAVVLEERPVDLAALAGEVAATCERPADVTVRTAGDPVLLGDPRRLHTVLRNLVGNALVHGRPPVLVDVLGAERTVEIRVSDQGDGVPTELAPVLFDRFVRGDRARGSGGTGLGLAIARSNAELHGAELRIDVGGPEPGAVFVLELPRR